MRTYHKKKTKTNTSNRTEKEGRETGVKNLDQVADDLEKLARRHLPDRVLQGVMTGQEEDIRQDAILLALSWYLRKETSTVKHSTHAWHAPRAIAGALKIIKRDYIKALKGEEEALLAMLPHLSGTICHPVMIRDCEWPTSTMQKVIRKSIRVVHRAGKISSLNAAIAMEALVDGIAVPVIAKRCGVHPSNIYQHLTRTRRHLPETIAMIEVSLNEVQ